MGKYLFKVSKITLEQRPFGRWSNVILLTLNRYLPTGSNVIWTLSFWLWTGICPLSLCFLNFVIIKSKIFTTSSKWMTVTAAWRQCWREKDVQRISDAWRQCWREKDVQWNNRGGLKVVFVKFVSLFYMQKPVQNQLNNDKNE